MCEALEDPTRWVNLFQWPGARFAEPNGGGKLRGGERNKLLREQLITTTPEILTKVDNGSNFKKQNETPLAATVRHRIDAGDTTGAVRILVNEI